MPNACTLLALVVGLSTVPLALSAQYRAAVLCVFAAGVLDGLDGPVARALRSTSRFGAELDSLCDLVNFGVAPTLLVYLWRFAALGWRGWLLSLVWVACMACRLARFNAGCALPALALSPHTHSLARLLCSRSVDFNQALWYDSATAFLASQRCCACI